MTLSFFGTKKRKRSFEVKEKLIQHSKTKLADRVAEDVEQIQKINKILGNGITLNIGKAVGVHHK